MYLAVAPTAWAPCWAPSQDDWLKLLSLTLPTSVTSPTLVSFIVVPPVAVVLVAAGGAAVSVAAGGAVVLVAAAIGAVVFVGTGTGVLVAVSPQAANTSDATTRMAQILLNRN